MCALQGCGTSSVGCPCPDHSLPGPYTTVCAHGGVGEQTRAVGPTKTWLSAERIMLIAWG